MPIIGLQRRLREAGRIRIGQQVAASHGKTRPEKLETFRVTSQDREAIKAVAGLFGGEPREWDGGSGTQWEVFTDATSLPILLPPTRLAFSQWFELWSGGGCKRRCDGERETISDSPCQCDPDPDKRDCKHHTRLSLILADLDGIGLWRLDTQGFYAATELAGAIEMVELLGGARIVPGRLMLEQREVKRPDEPPRKFAVPVLDLDLSVKRGLSPVAPALPPTVPVADQVAAAGSEPTRRRQAELPPTGVPVGQMSDLTGALNALAPEERKACQESLRGKFGSARDLSPEQIIDAVAIVQGWTTGATQLQVRAIHAILDKLGVPKGDGRTLYAEGLSGRKLSSITDLTKTQASVVIDALKQEEKDLES